MAVRGVGGKARRRLYLDSDTAWRTGIDAPVDDGATAPSWHVPGWTGFQGSGIVGHSQGRLSLWCKPCRCADCAWRALRARECPGASIGHTRGGSRRSPCNARMSATSTVRAVSIWLWAAVTLSLLAWILAGYPWLMCLIAVLPLLAPLNGLVRGRRPTYAGATLFAIPYLAFALTELLVNPSARWVASISLFLVFGWFCPMGLFLLASPGHRE